MPHEHIEDARKAHAAKLRSLTGKDNMGEFPPDKAERMAGMTNTAVSRNAAAPPEEVFVGAPARQVSNLGNIRK